jgi:hypothetical protein
MYDSVAFNMFIKFCITTINFRTLLLSQKKPHDPLICPFHLALVTTNLLSVSLEVPFFFWTFSIHRVIHYVVCCVRLLSLT